MQDSVLTTFCLNLLNHLNKCFLGHYSLISIENNINLLFAPITVHLSNKLSMVQRDVLLTSCMLCQLL